MSTYAGNSRIMYRQSDVFIESHYVRTSTANEYSIGVRIPISAPLHGRHEYKYITDNSLPRILTIYSMRGGKFVCRALTTSDDPIKYVQYDTNSQPNVEISTWDGEKMLIYAAIDQHVATDVPAQFIRIDPRRFCSWIYSYPLTLHNGALYMYIPEASVVHCRDLRMADPFSINVGMPLIRERSCQQSCVTNGGQLLTRIAGKRGDECVMLSDLRNPCDYYDLPPLPVERSLIQMLAD